jgi:hypothetical protein
MSITLLHERRNDDLQVQLYWDRDADAVYVHVHDRTTDEFFVLAPDRARALDAFYHPFCYAVAS